MPEVAQLKSGGDDVFGYPDFGWSFAVYNFKDSTGDFDHIVAQLYFRQTIDLQNQQDYIKSPCTARDQYGHPSRRASTAGHAGVPVRLATAKPAGQPPGGWYRAPTPAQAGLAPAMCGAGIPAGTRLAQPHYNNGTPLIGRRSTP